MKRNYFCWTMLAALIVANVTVTMDRDGERGIHPRHHTVTHQRRGRSLWTYILAGAAFFAMTTPTTALLGDNDNGHILMEPMRLPHVEPIKVETIKPIEWKNIQVNPDLGESCLGRCTGDPHCFCSEYPRIIRDDIVGEPRVFDDKR